MPGKPLLYNRSASTSKKTVKSHDLKQNLSLQFWSQFSFRADGAIGPGRVARDSDSTGDRILSLNPASLLLSALHNAKVPLRLAAIIGT